MKKYSWRIGDIFGVPLTRDRVGVGQIVAKYRSDGYYFALFADSYPADSLPEPGAITSRPIAVLALSLDAKLAAGHWRIFGHASVSSDIPLPAYKEARVDPEGFDVVDYSGALRRPATNAEAELLPFRKVVSPARVEKALRAASGLEPWDSNLSALRPRSNCTWFDFFPETRASTS